MASKKPVTIKLTGGYVLMYMHDQYFWIGSEEPGSTILCSTARTSPRRFAKAVLAVRAKALLKTERKGRPK